MFVETFKTFKRKDISLDLSTVIDPDILGNEGKLIKKLPNVIESNQLQFGVTPAKTWNIFEFIDHPGLVLIRNPFSTIGQRYWSVRCLRDYQRPPNRTNLTNLGKGVENWWQDLQLTTTDNDYNKLRNALRWVTLGYHHNWDTKVYSEEDFNSFPEDLSLLISTVFAPALGYTNYQPQAAIVNYYPQGSTLSGHTDHSEVNLEAPLFSISFGQSAIFLIGGTEKSHPATPILLRSGDVLVMAKQSRLCYHAVPRILHGSEEKWNEKVSSNKDIPSNSSSIDLWTSCQDDSFWSPFDKYLRDCRINLNVRQVLNKDQTRLS